MTLSPDRLLGPKAVVQTTATLGRVFNVTCETWRLSDDPKQTEPVRELVATARTASEAADLARDAALRCPRNGFHKPSGAWWGADGERFHRFVVHAGRQRSLAGPVGMAAVLGLGVLTVLRLSRRRSGPESAG